METNTPRQHRPEERVIPLWNVGRPRPVGKERRKDAGAIDRHVQAGTGVAPSAVIQQRQPTRPPLEQTIRLWLEVDDADHEPQPASLIRAA